MRKFTFIDLFAGIGGMRLAFESVGGVCVFASEIDPQARKTYAANFGHEPAGDIREIESDAIPEHDILLAGFPCQPFSISGVSKKRSLGQPVGFEDKVQGTLFFEIARILHDKRPRAFLLENVKHLVRHDGGRTFRTILDVLEIDLGYDVHWKVLDARPLVPQHRERVFIVGFREPRKFQFPTLPEHGPPLRSILETDVPPKYTLSDRLWQFLQEYAEKHRRRGNGFGFGLADLEGHARTLSARYYKDGSEILIPQAGKNPRKLTPREAARLMGFPDSFKIVVSDTQAYRQFGNSVVVPLVRLIAVEMLKSLRRKPAKRKRTSLFAEPAPAGGAS